MKSRNFLVTSRGQCGTRWLARALNSHPDIVCSHGPGDPVVSLNYDRLPTDAERKGNIEGITAQRFQSMGVDDVFVELASGREGKAYGNVHMFTLRTLAESVRRRPAQRPFRLVNLVRHPISWVQSASHNQATIMGISETLYKQRMAFYRANKTLFDGLTRPYGVDPTEPANLAFLGSCVGSIPGMASEIGTPGVVQVTMERITTDRRFFLALVQGLAGEDIPLDGGWVDAVFEAGKTNAHAPDGPSEAEARFAAWPQWKQAACAAILGDQNIRHAFEGVGYDLSFVASPMTYVPAQAAL